MATFFESLFAFLFKYRPAVFEQGRLAWRPPVPAAWILVGLSLAVLLVIVTYARARGKTRTPDRLLLATLRIAILAIVGFALMRPTLVLSSVVPQQNWVGVLLDDSRSMRIADAGGEARGAVAAAQFTDRGSELARTLAETFQLRYFRFAGQTSRIDPTEPLTFGGAATRLAPALTAARAELGSLPLSGLVVVSDGADNAATGLSETLLSLKAAGIPVFTVGVGADRFERDIELTRVNVPRSALRGSALVVDLMLAQNGYGGRTVPVQVEDGGRIIAVEDVELPRDGEPSAVRVNFTLAEPGARRVRFRIPPQDGELIAENNEQEAVITVRGAREKILYFEGEPRWELKYLRRAVAEDSSLQVVALQRTADQKFLRLDVDSAGELYGGFPTTREELFTYRALVLGSVEASFFTHDQLQMIADFVAERGGGLLVLGGRSAFAEGGYAGTPVAEALPVTLTAARDTTYFAELDVRPTSAGLVHAALRVADDEPGAERRWQTLPPLTTVNRVGAVKPGATALLTGSGAGVNQPVLAFHRYGRGIAMAFAVQDTWLWQMHAAVPLEDQTHERLWRQLLRWLVNDAPDRVVAGTSSDHAAPGEPVRITATVADERYLRVNDGRVNAEVITPAGASLDVPLEWSLTSDGEYRGSFTPTEPGLHEIRVHAERAGTTHGSAPTYVQVSESTAEFYGAQRREPLLRRIASETGGRYYDAASLDGLVEDISHAGRGATVREERELWDMPIVLILALLLLATEWGYRRWRALA
jgi:uncharacterized membrane protein